MLRVKVEVRDCEFGKGLFAAEFIPMGTTIWSPSQDTVFSFPKDVVDRMPKELANCIKKFCWEKAGQVHIDLTDMTYVNHSDSPNVKQAFWNDVAARDIEQGEQLFIDYREIDLNGDFCSEFLKGSE